ncbi:phosphatase PAP2 family protein [Candidatus Saccharibacteria bacterium]|nr:phosphatase PAP2 family protein [Candidatus Saccharibacteria bacterium]
MAKRDKTWNWLLLFGSISGLLASSLLAKRGTLVLGEEHLLGWVYGLPESFRLFFLAVTLLGSAWVFAIVLILLLLKERFDIGLRVMIAGLAAYAIAGMAKQLIARPRPGELVSDVLQRELLVWGYGFPSAHTALATALAITLGAYLPKKRKYIIALWIGIVAVSRLYLGVHAPLDIVGGFCIGLLVSTCVLIILPPHKAVRGIRLVKTRKQA